ncbi:MAG: adenine deaminase C-terminal domain-containing protein [Roseobacter sp.]
MPEADLTDRKLRERAVAAAQGKCPFDLLIKNARILDMVTGRERQADIGIVGALIASVHSVDRTTEAVQYFDAKGAFALPGLIDTHMHIESSMVTPQEYAAAVVPTGVTTVVWDPHEFANVCGVAGVDYAIATARDLPLRILTLAPTCVPSAPGFEQCGGDFDPDTIAGLLSRPEVHGAAELMTMQPLLEGDARVSGIVDAARKSGKRICGHARGLADGALAAYAAAGVETDHELTSAADLIARLEAGMTVELRVSHRYLLPEFAAALLDLGHLPQTVTLCTDDVFPDELLNQGGMPELVRLLISYGLPAAWVYQAATFNAANKIERKDLGLIAPGRRADFMLLNTLSQVCPEYVFSDGCLIAENGALTEVLKTPQIPNALCQTMQLTPLQSTDFEIKATGQEAQIATLSQPRFPVWGARNCLVKENIVVLPPDLVRMAVINRYGAGTPARVAVLENWGFWRGAFASSVSHDSHNLTVFGCDPQEMAVAANAVCDLDGGLVVVEKGGVVASLSLPIAGLVSANNLETVAKNFANIRKAMDELVDWSPPLLVFKALFGASLVCNAGPRLSDVGLVDPFNGTILKSCVVDVP